MTEGRVIIYHQQSTSAKTLFLQLPYGGVCGFEPVPSLAVVVDPEIDEVPEDNVHGHPAPLLKKAADFLGLDPDEFRTNCEFRAVLDVPGENIEVWLARVMTTDPPYEQAAAAESEFVPLTSLRNVGPMELELLGRAYKAILG